MFSKQENCYTGVKRHAANMMFLRIISLLLWYTTPSASAPLRWELVDMTYVFDETTLNFPGLKKFELTVIFNGTMPDGYWVQAEEYSSTIHAGTHMDAPCHFSLVNWCMDEIPFERFQAPAAVIDITDKAKKDSDATVSVEDLQKWELMAARRLDGHIVVMRSGWGSRWGDKKAYIGNSDDDSSKMHFPGISPEAAQWLVDNRDVYGVAVDTLSLDNGPTMNAVSHRILFGNNILGLENVANVEKIPVVGAFLYMYPMKIGGASGAPTRIVAKFPKILKPEDGDSVTDSLLGRL